MKGNIFDLQKKSCYLTLLRQLKASRNVFSFPLPLMFTHVSLPSQYMEAYQYIRVIF